MATHKRAVWGRRGSHRSTERSRDPWSGDAGPESNYLGQHQSLWLCWQERYSHQGPVHWRENPTFSADDAWGERSIHAASRRLQCCKQAFIPRTVQLWLRSSRFLGHLLLPYPLRTKHRSISQYLSSPRWSEHDRVLDVRNRQLVHHWTRRASQAVPLGYSWTRPKHGACLCMPHTRYRERRQGRRGWAFHLHCQLWCDLAAFALGMLCHQDWNHQDWQDLALSRRNLSNQD